MLLFAICQSLYDSLDKILTIFIRIKDKIKCSVEKVTMSIEMCLWLNISNALATAIWLQCVGCHGSRRNRKDFSQFGKCFMQQMCFYNGGTDLLLHVLVAE